MGYRGKVAERARARELRARGWTLPEISAALAVAKSSVSRWVRDIEVDPAVRRSPTTGRRPRGSDHPLRQRRLAETARLRAEARERIGAPTDRELLMAGLGLYAGDGSKSDKEVCFSNSNDRLVAFFCRWLRHEFEIDEQRLRLRLYLHEGLDLDRATAHWASVTGIPPGQFRTPYRAAPDATIRHSKHEFGCAHVLYACSRTQRTILGLVDALVEAGMAPGAGLEPATS